MGRGGARDLGAGEQTDGGQAGFGVRTLESGFCQALGQGGSVFSGSIHLCYILWIGMLDRVAGKDKRPHILHRREAFALRTSFLANTDDCSPQHNYKDLKPSQY